MILTIEHISKHQIITISEQQLLNHKTMLNLSFMHLVSREALTQWQTDPWAFRPLMRRSLSLIHRLAKHDKLFGAQLFNSLRRPFAAYSTDLERLTVRARLASAGEFDALCVEAVSALEPNPLWERWFLEARATCYARHLHPRATEASSDLEQFDRFKPLGLGEDL